MKTNLLFALLLGCAACNKEWDAPAAPGTATARAGEVLINEAVAGASQEVDEFGQRSDWFEIFNPGPAITLRAGVWFVTDDAAEPLKYELPELDIEENGYLLIRCDGMDVVQREVHTNFAIESKGETILINAFVNGDPVMIDQRAVGNGAGDGFSEGRMPDASANWTRLAMPTPGAANEMAVGE